MLGILSHPRWLCVYLSLESDEASDALATSGGTRGFDLHWTLFQKLCSIGFLLRLKSDFARKNIAPAVLQFRVRGFYQPDPRSDRQPVKHGRLASPGPSHQNVELIIRRGLV